MNYMFVPNFEARDYVTLVLEPQKPPRKFGVKSGLSQKWLKYAKKYFIWLYVLKYPFIPTNPRLAARTFIFFFFPFFPLFFLFFLPNFSTLFFS